MITFRALFALVLLLNGLAVPPAMAVHAAGWGPDASPAHDSADMTGGDCCDAERCDCGCAAPHVLTLPVSQAGTALRTALPGFNFVVNSLHSSPLPALFRPPA